MTARSDLGAQLVGRRAGPASLGVRPWHDGSNTASSERSGESKSSEGLLAYTLPEDIRRQQLLEIDRRFDLADLAVRPDDLVRAPGLIRMLLLADRALSS